VASAECSALRAAESLVPAWDLLGGMVGACWYLPNEIAPATHDLMGTSAHRLWPRQNPGAALSTHSSAFLPPTLYHRCIGSRQSASQSTRYLLDRFLFLEYLAAIN
jgi:hypothetical protein